MFSALIQYRKCPLPENQSASGSMNNRSIPHRSFKEFDISVKVIISDLLTTSITSTSSGNPPISPGFNIAVFKGVLEFRVEGGEYLCISGLVATPWLSFQEDFGNTCQS